MPENATAVAVKDIITFLGYQIQWVSMQAHKHNMLTYVRNEMKSRDYMMIFYSPNQANLKLEVTRNSTELI
jgi:hypothetical protein